MGRNFTNRQWFPRGFTLIELVVVIAIIGIITAFVSLNFVGIRQRGRDAQRKSDIRQIQSAFELYRSDEGNYPATFTSCGASVSFTSSDGSVTYLKRVPCDPLDGTTPYNYIAEPSGCDNSGTPCSGYTLYACVENTKDTDPNITSVNPGGPACSAGAYFVVDNP